MEPSLWLNAAECQNSTTGHARSMEEHGASFCSVQRFTPRPVTWWRDSARVAAATPAMVTPARSSAVRVIIRDRLWAALVSVPGYLVEDLGLL